MFPAKDKLPITRGHRAVRIAGATFLSGCAVMLVLGITVLADELHGPLYLLYWSWCFLLAVLAIGFAGWDMLLLRRLYQRSTRELFRQQFPTDPSA